MASVTLSNGAAWMKIYLSGASD
jgi:hypothetical protein